MTILIACLATAVLAFVVGTIFGGIMVGGGSEDAYKAGLTVGSTDLKLLHNRRTIDFETSVMTIFDDDDVTPILVRNLSAEEMNHD